MLLCIRVGLIKPLACAAASESIESWRVKIETAWNIEPSECDGVATQGPANNAKLS